MNRPMTALICALIGAITAANTALADAPSAYTVNVAIRAGQPSSIVPGQSQSVLLDVILQAQPDITHTSLVINVIFSAPGLELQSIVWASPYTADPLWNDTVPADSQLPALLTPGTWVRPVLDPGITDIQLANVIPDPAQSFASGVVATLALRVPLQLTEPAVTIAAEVDTIADGAGVLSAQSGAAATLVLVPSPGPASLGLLILLGMPRRRRRAASVVNE